eukprot:6192415-Pleurochrysis_carterae.AAC.2
MASMEKIDESECVARKSLVRLRDARYFTLLKHVESERKAGTDEQVLIATVLAYQGKYQEAARMYAKANRVDKAIELFTDLRMWDAAKQYSHNASGEQVEDKRRMRSQTKLTYVKMRSHEPSKPLPSCWLQARRRPFSCINRAVKTPYYPCAAHRHLFSRQMRRFEVAAQELVRKQAAWAEETQDMGAASETYIAAGDYMKAIHILGEQGWTNKLADVSRKLTKNDTAELRVSAASLGSFSFQDSKNTSTHTV